MLLACSLLGAAAACRLPQVATTCCCRTSATASCPQPLPPLLPLACVSVPLSVGPRRAVAKHKQRAEEITASIDAKHRWAVRPCWPADPAFHWSHVRYFQSSHAPAYHCVCFYTGQTMASMPPCLSPSMQRAGEDHPAAGVDQEPAGGAAYASAAAAGASALRSGQLLGQRQG